MAIFTKTGYTKRYCLLHPWKVVMHKCCDIKNAWQRATKGYCSEDVWNIDSWFLKIMPQMLDEFVKEHNGHPTDITNEDWNKILTKMSKAFRNAYEETTEFANPYEEEYLSSLNFDFKSGNVTCTSGEELKKNYYEAEEAKEKLMEKSFDEGMELFHKYFRMLWD